MAYKFGKTFEKLLVTAVLSAVGWLVSIIPGQPIDAAEGVALANLIGQGMLNWLKHRDMK